MTGSMYPFGTWKPCFGPFAQLEMMYWLSPIKEYRVAGGSGRNSVLGARQEKCSWARRATTVKYNGQILTSCSQPLQRREHYAITSIRH